MYKCTLSLLLKFCQKPHCFCQAVVIFQKAGHWCENAEVLNSEFGLLPFPLILGECCCFPELSIFPHFHSEEGCDLALGFGWACNTHGVLIKFHGRQNLEIQTIQPLSLIVSAVEVPFTSEICYYVNMLRKRATLTKPSHLKGLLRCWKAPCWRIYLSFIDLSIDRSSLQSVYIQYRVAEEMPGVYRTSILPLPSWHPDFLWGTCCPEFWLFRSLSGSWMNMWDTYRNAR